MGKQRDRKWHYLTVPSSWKGHRNWQDHPTLGGYTGYAWYRCFVRIPSEWAGETCHLFLGYVSESDETYINGKLVGSTREQGGVAGDEKPALSEYDIDAEDLNCGDWNLVAARVHNSGEQDSGGGLVGVQYGMSDFLYRDYHLQTAGDGEDRGKAGASAPARVAPDSSYDRGRWLGVPGRELCITCSQGALSLVGQWQFRRGDDRRWASWPGGEMHRDGARAAVAEDYLSGSRTPVGDSTPLLAGSPSSPPPSEPLSLWYRRPATDWHEALPLGNGRVGAMIHGIPGHDRIQLNEESIWAGRPDDRDRSGAHAAFVRAREALFAGKYAKAHRIVDRRFLAPNPVRSYQSAGVLHCDIGVGGRIADYRRELDLTQAVARMSYRDRGRIVECLAFASAVDDVLVVRYQSDRSGGIDLRLWMDRIDHTTDTPAQGTASMVEAGYLVQRGYASHTRQQKDAWGAPIRLRPIDENRGVGFEIRVQVIVEGGQRHDAADSIVVESADSLMVLAAIETDSRGADPTQRAAKLLRDASARSFDELKTRHVNDHRRFFERTRLSLGPPSTLPTDELVRAAKQGSPDPHLVGLLFQYGRYLMLGCSRPGCLPTNNSGIWNPYLTAQWDSDFHLDMDLSLRYWAVEACNLPECHEPFADFVDKLRLNGRKTASQLYRCRGFTAHCTTDGHFYTDAVGGLWYGPFFASSAWLCWHLWDHYRYSENREYLRDRAWPLMREAALFYLDVLIPDPQTGNLVSGPSVSPENHYITPKGMESDLDLGPGTDYETIRKLVRRGLIGTLDMGPAMDQELIGNLFENCVAAAEALGIEDPIVDDIRSAGVKLASPHRIGTDGRLLEWSREYGELEPGHRHISHLWDLYPGERIDPDRTPDLANAAKLVLERRWDECRELGQTAWSSTWNSLFWSRLREPDRSWENVAEVFRVGMLPNLFSTEPPMLLDGTFGCGAVVTEMLMQSHNDIILLLPSLPSAIGSGTVTGLRARGGFEVSIEWADGSLVSATVRSLLGKTCRVRPGARVAVECDGLLVEAETFEGAVMFDTRPSKVYRLSPSGPPSGFTATNTPTK